MRQLSVCLPNPRNTSDGLVPKCCFSQTYPGDTVKFTVYAEIELPRVPNFVRFANGSGTLSIGDVTDNSLRGIAAEWTEALLKRAAEIRLAPRPHENDDGRSV